MKKIIYLTISLIILNGCGCDPDCNEWETCISSSDMFGTQYRCFPMLNKYGAQYSGIENLILSDYPQEVFRKQKIIKLGLLESDPSNYMRICLEDYCGYNDVNSRNIYVIFDNPNSGKFSIPKQTEFDSIMHPNLPASNNLLYTQVTYEGSGNIISVDGDYMLTIDCSIEFTNQTGTISYTGYSN